ncbi:MAG TPA: serine/threonine-protein kinase [Ktedonobacteraceae bacterium]|nr:serine/threonine-protein kinase [Ktedonobacteraceae bacterium]
MENDGLIGQQIGAYHIQSKLGEGGMARVYKAYHARLRREVAIKVILAHIAEQADFKVRFEREAQLVANLQHPNIVAVYDFGDFGNLTYLVMQYVGGGTLRDKLRGGHALDPRQATMYAFQMGNALHHAHLRGIVHRDVKPQNMLVSSNDPNQLLLSDFGIAKLYDARHEPTLLNITGSATTQDPSLTSADQIVGTAEYMSPEQINGRPVDARTDVYALGVVLFQMLTGEVPFQSTTVQGLLFQHVYTPPRRLRELNPYASETLENIIARAMAKAPADRFQSAEEMAQALEAANANATYKLPPSQPGDSDWQRTSLYGQPSQVNTPGAASAYGTPSRSTSAGGASISMARPHTRRKLTSYIMAGLVVLLAIGLILAKTGILFSPTPSQGFTENFQNNDRNWTIGSLNYLTASIANNQYKLQISGAPAGGQTYFPHPEAGTLPDNFTLTASIEETQADASSSYGLAFREKDNGSSGVSCYALIIHGDGSFQVLKYDPNDARSYIALGQSNHPFSAIKQGLNQFNKLQVTVKGSAFSFTINGVPLPGSISPDTSLTGGQLALLVSGTNSTFIANNVTLAIP